MAGIITVFAVACNTETNTQPPVAKQPVIVLPEEWQAISHDPLHPTDLTAYVDSAGVLQEQFK